MLLNSEFTSDVFSLRHWYFFWLQQRRYERGDHYVACSMLFPVTFFFLLKAGGDLDLIIFQTNPVIENRLWFVVLRWMRGTQL